MRLIPWALVLFASAASARTAPQIFIDHYCVACHNQTLRTAGLAFEDLAAPEADAQAVWENILRQVRTGAMPPAGARQPAAELRREISLSIENALDSEAAVDPNPGRPVVHRLNRTEYANAVRDLFGVKVDVNSLLPPDDSGYGFDNIGDLLSVSPTLVERYLSAARRVSELAVQNLDRRRDVFACPPANEVREESCAKLIIARVVRRAYRRPVTKTDLKPLLGFYEAGRRGGRVRDGIQAALRAVLVSPEFLVRVEHDPAGASGAVHGITDWDLASRLSFFLWSSLPDDELLDCAERGILGDTAVLEHQVRRMLEDPRSDALVQNFAGQWLLLRNLPLIQPDLNAFPEFDPPLRDAFRHETELFVADIIREDRSVVDFLTARFTFLNERLARHYGIEGIQGNEFRRVDLNDHRRGGLLGQGSILMLTSYPSRTSVVLRGKWILENILGDPPPPPPPDVPVLPAAVGQKPVSLRQRMEQHRAQPACSVCHARMDPLGFALENYDAVGKWRTEEAGAPVDATARLPDGTEFAGAAGLRNVLLERRGQFIEAFTRKLMTYALGRGLEWYDQPSVRAIERDAARDEFRFSSIVLGIVKSTPFQMRKTP